MTVRIRSVDYDHEGTALRGQLAWNDEWTTPRPGVVVVHDAMKSDQGFEEERAVVLAGHGYPGFALDVYGADVQGDDPAEAARLMRPFQEDRTHLQARLRAGLEAAADQAEIDGDEMAAIGYCFGGQCVLDLARWNAPVRGVASFHGLLAPPDPERADLPSEPIAPKVLAFHGDADPFVPVETLRPFADEMNTREADWQLHSFGHALHAFTNVRYQPPADGAGYDERTARRSWTTLLAFLAEILPEPSGA